MTWLPLHFFRRVPMFSDSTPTTPSTEQAQRRRRSVKLELLENRTLLSNISCLHVRPSTLTCDQGGHFQRQL